MTDTVIVYKGIGTPPGAITLSGLATDTVRGDGTCAPPADVQATLTSGTNIKTINSVSVLGAGNIAISGDAAWGSVTGTLSDQTDLQSALDAKQASGSYATGAQGATADSALQPAGNGGSLTGLTKTQVGLANADNTTDAGKPVSTAQQTALDLKANLAGPTFTGTVGGVTAAMVGAPAGSGTSSGSNSGDQTISDATITTTDITTNDATTAKHGFMPKGTGSTATFFRSDMTQAAPTAAAADPAYSPGSFTVATETAKILSRHLKLSGSQRATLAGTATLRIT